MQKNENRPGYKETKVGWIPDDWETRPINKLVNPKRPIGYGVVQTGDHQPNGIPCVRVTDLNSKKIDSQNMIRTTDEIHQSYKRTILKEGDVIVALRGEVGLCRTVTSELKGVNLTRGVALLSQSAKFVPSFLCDCFESSMVSRWIHISINGSALKEIPIASLRKIPIPLPPLPEQKAIAEILSCWDVGLGDLEKLIDAKKLRKKGLMQQLLTGTRRLPGFQRSEDGGQKSDWKEVRLGDAFTERKKTKCPDLPFLAITGDRGIIPTDQVNRIDTNSVDKDLYKHIAPEDIGYNTMRMWQGTMGVCKSDGLVSPAYVVCKPKKHTHSLFFYYLFKSHKGMHQLWAYSYGITNDRLRLYYRDFAKVPVSLPTLEEQQAIAEVLETADEEISLLEAERDALSEQKKGLMQKLLTGEVRLSAFQRTED